MSSEAQLNNLAVIAAEGVLERIYGADLEGCTVSLDSVTEVIRGALDQLDAQDRALLELYEKAIEAIQLLATPPQPGSELTPEALQSLLGERLDTIHTLALKIATTTAGLKEQPDAEDL